MRGDSFVADAMNGDGEALLLVCFARISSNEVTRNCPVESSRQISFFRNEPK